MAGNHYEQINVSGGAVHAGDTIFNLNFTSDVVLNELTTFNVRGIADDLGETAEYCAVLEEALASIKGAPRSLEELRNDVEELQCAVNTLQVSVEDGFIDIAMPSVIRSHLRELWPSVNRHKEMLLAIKASVHRWHLSRTMVHTSVVSTEIFRTRRALRSLRRKLNTSIALVHLSTLQSFRQTSAEQMARLRRQIENIQEELDNQRMRSIPNSLPFSYYDLSKSDIVHDPHYPMRRYLEANSVHSEYPQPSMQISTLQSGITSETGTFVSAIEYMVKKPPKPVALLLRSSSIPAVMPNGGVIDFTSATAVKASISYIATATTPLEDRFYPYRESCSVVGSDPSIPRTFTTGHAALAYHDPIRRALALRRTRLRGALRVQRFHQQRMLVIQQMERLQITMMPVFNDQSATSEQHEASKKQQLSSIGIKQYEYRAARVGHPNNNSSSTSDQATESARISRTCSKFTIPIEIGAEAPHLFCDIGPIFSRHPKEWLRCFHVSLCPDPDLIYSRSHPSKIHLLLRRAYI